MSKKSRNGDTLGSIELMYDDVWPEQGNQGEWREQEDQGEVSIIIFGMNKSSGFKIIAYAGYFSHFVYVFVFVVVFDIVFVFVFCVLLWFFNSFHHKLSEYEWVITIGWVCEA